MFFLSFLDHAKVFIFLPLSAQIPNALYCSGITTNSCHTQEYCLPFGCRAKSHQGKFLFIYERSCSLRALSRLRQLAWCSQANPSPNPSPDISPIIDEKMKDRRQKVFEAKISSVDASTGDADKAKRSRSSHVHCLRLAISLEEVGKIKLNKTVNAHLYKPSIYDTYSYFVYPYMPCAVPCRLRSV